MYARSASSQTVAPSPRTIVIAWSRTIAMFANGCQNEVAMNRDAIRMRPSVVPGREPPWWLQEAPLDPVLPALAGSTEVDVAVVGGGYTGLWTALELRGRDPSLRVAVL